MNKLRSLPILSLLFSLIFVSLISTSCTDGSWFNGRTMEDNKESDGFGISRSLKRLLRQQGQTSFCSNAIGKYLFNFG